MKVFVTGGSSPLGEHVVSGLQAAGHQALCLARSDAASERVTRAGGAVIAGDLAESGWHQLASRSDAMLHLAGIRFTRDLMPALGGNLRVVAVSSASVANPHHPLAATVREGEAILRAGQPDAVVLRPTMIYGSPRDRNMGTLARLVARAPAIPRGVGGGLIQPIAVWDVADAVIGGLATAGPATIDIGGPDAVRLGELLELLADLLGKRHLPIPMPVGGLATLARRTGLGSRHRALHAIEMLSFDRMVEPVESALLGRPATPLRAGLRRALAAYGLLDGEPIK